MVCSVTGSEGVRESMGAVGGMDRQRWSVNQSPFPAEIFLQVHDGADGVGDAAHHVALIGNPVWGCDVLNSSFQVCER